MRTQVLHCQDDDNEHSQNSFEPGNSVEKGFWDLSSTAMVLEHLICELDGITVVSGQLLT